MSLRGWSEQAVDWLAVPECASALLDGAPAWVFSRDGGRVLWANDAGGRKLGMAAFSALSRWRLPDAHPLRRDVASIARSLGARGGLGRLRFLGGLNAEPVSCRCSRVATSGGERGILLVALAPPATGSGGREAAVRFLADDGIAVGLYDEAGRREAAAANDPHGDRLDALDRLGARVAGGMRSGDASAGEEVDGVRIGVASVPHGSARLFLVLADLSASNDRDRLARAPADAPKPVNAARNEARTVLGEPVRVASADTADSVRSRASTRFLWETDADDRVILVSPGLAHVAGRHADIVGERWRDAAERLGLDPSGRIAVALARRDTWSGLTAWWPLEDEAIRVPAELTALPVFSADGAFQGFRGFGVLKPSDALTRDAFERRFAVQPAAPAPPRGDAARSDGVVEVGSNVVPIRGDRERLADFVRLSPNERIAFEEIAAALGARIEGAVAAPSMRSAAAADADAAHRMVPAAGLPLATAQAVRAREPFSLPVSWEPSPAIIPDRSEADGDEAGEAQGDDDPGIPRDAVDGSGGGHAAEPDQGVANAPAEPGGGADSDRDLEAAPFDARYESGDFGAVGFMPSAFHVPAATAAREAEALRVPDEPSATRGMGDIDELIALLETAADAVLVVDGEGRVTVAGPGAQALLGMDGRRLAGRSFLDALSPRSRSIARQHLADLAMPGGEGLRRDASEIEASIGGAVVPLLITASRPPVAGGGIIVCLRDISVRAQAEAALTAAREAAVLERLDFLARLSGEITAPLSAIAGFAATMMGPEADAAQPERRRERLRDMREAAEHVLTLVSGLSDIARIEAGARSLMPAAAPLNDIVREAIAEAGPDAARARVILRSSLAAELPPVIADPGALKQAVLDLVTQSVRFAGAGGQVIASTTLAESGEAILRIRDTGEARSGEALARTLTPFRADEPSDGEPSDEKAGAAGSLALGKALVEANRARFSLRSAQGEGTIMSIVFPATRVLSE